MYWLQMMFEVWASCTCFLGNEARASPVLSSHARAVLRWISPRGTSHIQHNMLALPAGTFSADRVQMMLNYLSHHVYWRELLR